MPQMTGSASSPTRAVGKVQTDFRSTALHLPQHAGPVVERAKYRVPFVDGDVADQSVLGKRIACDHAFKRRPVSRAD